ncbi:MAG: hypothetical protein JSS02_03780 [Planctomycetes bacterium]|nr:hypothetical protein [Planctomycetota bacterium]
MRTTRESTRQRGNKQQADAADTFRRTWGLILALLLLPPLSGCPEFNTWIGGRFNRPVQCVISEDATAHEIVLHLNENTHKLRGWKTTHAKIATRGNMLIPKVDAMVYIQTPRNFRIVADGPMGGKEVDFGSNSEQYWLWIRRNEAKQVVVASHDLDPERARKLPFPFQPDWIMEAMGVIDLNPDEDLLLEPGSPNSYMVSLIAERISPQGRKVRKVTVVDRRTGMVHEHSLWDSQGQLIAKAVLSQYARDDSSTAFLPMRIDFDWPQANLGLTMLLADVQVNPTSFPQSTWVLPSFPGYEMVDLNQ